MHKLKEPGKEKWLQYCIWFTHFIWRGIDILDKVFYSGEAWFHLSGCINSQNSRIWSAENLHSFHERPLHSLTIGVWCAVSRRRIIGPVFFSDTITAEHYQEGMDYKFHFPFGSWWTKLLVSVRWGYGAYRKFNNADVERVLWWSHYFLKLVAPGSVDLSPPDLYFWGFLKENVYKNNPHTLEELKHNIELCISNVTAETLHWVASDMRKRLNACIAERSGHFQHLI
jgi:hypothetical protein